MERRFYLREQVNEAEIDYEYTITETKLRARIDAIINLRIIGGGEHWTWQKAIKILTGGDRDETKNP